MKVNIFLPIIAAGYEFFTVFSPLQNTIMSTRCGGLLAGSPDTVRALTSHPYLAHEERAR
jgi:hypothetical protein